MPRRPREATGGLVYHVLNRSVRGMPIFEHDLDYKAFTTVLTEATVFQPMRILHFSVMPNHWHFLLWPLGDGDLSEFVRWLTLTHTQRYHAAHDTTGGGPIYRGRFKSFPVQEDEHYLTVARYIERNPLRAGLVRRAEGWRWGSLWLRSRDQHLAATILSDGPVPLPTNATRWINQPQTDRELNAIRLSIRRGRPFGDHNWQQAAAARLGLEASLRPLGRPRRA